MRKAGSIVVTLALIASSVLSGYPAWADGFEPFCLAISTF